MITVLLNWFNGWRIDFDGWLVRARRRSDHVTLPPEVGFVEECAIVVRTTAYKDTVGVWTLGSLDKLQQFVAEVSVGYADALLKELNK